MTTYRAAVIGLGRMGSTFDDEMSEGGSIFLPYCHAPSYCASPHTELVAGADPHDEQCAIFGDRWGLAQDHLYSDYRQMLERENLDLVSVCTTARIRSQIVQDCARAGVKAVWAEKPIALTLAEADAMVEACRQHGTALAINCARRWNPFFSQARDLIDKGRARANSPSHRLCPVRLVAQRQSSHRRCALYGRGAGRVGFWRNGIGRRSRGRDRPAGQWLPRL